MTDPAGKPKASTGKIRRRVLTSQERFRACKWLESLPQELLTTRNDVAAMGREALGIPDLNGSHVDTCLEATGRVLAPPPQGGSALERRVAELERKLAALAQQLGAAL